MFTLKLQRAFPVVLWGVVACSNGAVEDEGAPQVGVTQASILQDTSGPIGTWFLVGNGYRLKLTIAQSGGGYSGTLDGAAIPSADITWNASTRILEFRRPGSGWHQWYRLEVTEGVTLGRFSHKTMSAKPTVLTDYTYQVSGWNQQYIDHGATTPRAYELIVNGDYRAKLRVDREGTSLVGRFKVHSRVSSGAFGEELEQDVQINSWNGSNLQFTRTGSGWIQVFTGQVTNNTISGTFTHNGVGAYPWSGMRANVLGYGLTHKDNSNQWRCRTRRALGRLMMGGRPTGTLISANPASWSCGGITQGPPYLCAEPSCPAALRDDDPANHPQNYSTQRYEFVYSIPNPYGGSPVQRTVTGWLATPNGTPPSGGFPAAMVLNGHAGSAWELFLPSHQFYWHGDGFARRNFVVLALDISHRPPNERQGLYAGYADGDNSCAGNGSHPAIRMPGFSTSDWVDDGERAWDVIQSFEWLRQRSNVNSDRISVMGLSMGGEIATLAAAMEPRIAMAISAGYSPDYDTISHNDNHACFQWAHTYQCNGCGEGSIVGLREYVDHSDFLALIGDRTHVVETGVLDDTFSKRDPLFSGDKQVLRRARAAYDSPGALLHFLHPLGHHPRLGDVTVPVMIAPPPAPSWQTDSWVSSQGYTVLDLASSAFQFYYDDCAY